MSRSLKILDFIASRLISSSRLSLSLSPSVRHPEISQLQLIQRRRATEFVTTLLIYNALIGCSGSGDARARALLLVKARNPTVQRIHSKQTAVTQGENKRCIPRPDIIRELTHGRAARRISAGYKGYTRSPALLSRRRIKAA